MEWKGWDGNAKEEGEVRRDESSRGAGRCGADCCDMDEGLGWAAIVDNAGLSTAEREGVSAIV